MRNIFRTVAWLLILTVLTLGCSRVSRLSSSQTTDLSGRWNDTDSRLVAEEMTKDIINRPWREKFLSTHKNKKPTVLLGVIANKGYQHIEPETFIKDIEREVINTGTVRIVANSTFREKLRGERIEQQSYASPETQKRLGRELGADFMMFGTINTIVDTKKKDKVVFYQINLELVDLETNEVVWVGAKKIKKYLGGKRVKEKYSGKEQ